MFGRMRKSMHSPWLGEGSGKGCGKVCIFRGFGKDKTGNECGRSYFYCYVQGYFGEWNEYGGGEGQAPLGGWDFGLYGEEVRCSKPI